VIRATVQLGCPRNVFRTSVLGRWQLIERRRARMMSAIVIFVTTNGGARIAASVKTIGKVVLALVAMVAAVFLALTCGSYGGIGVHAVFTEHLAWTEAAMVYWTLLFTAILSAMAALREWRQVVTVFSPLFSLPKTEPSGVRTCDERICPGDFLRLARAFRLVPMG
jgi:hypothetical protein